MNTARYIFIGSVIGLCLGLLFGGCGEAPEGFSESKPAACVITPGDLYQYACQNKAYERCWTRTGDVKYSNCEYMGVICVASCSEVD